jgi:aspartate aminotransferase, mitochondrial
VSSTTPQWLAPKLTFDFRLSSALQKRSRETAIQKRSISVCGSCSRLYGTYALTNVHIGVGAYRDDNGKPYVLPSVKAAEQKVVNASLDKEYAGITGIPSFTKAAMLLAYGTESTALKEDRVAITQSISGTGALRIGGAFLERFYPNAKTVYIPTPSWANHGAVFKDSGLKVEKYRYYNPETIGLDFEGMVADIKAMPKNSIVLLHVCAHNPTGVDPTQEQWKAISDAVKEGGHYPFFDMAYQGFASGDTDRDAFALRHFIQEGHHPCLAQSFAKNMVRESLRRITG